MLQLGGLQGALGGALGVLGVGDLLGGAVQLRAQLGDAVLQTADLGVGGLGGIARLLLEGGNALVLLGLERGLGVPLGRNLTFQLAMRVWRAPICATLVWYEEIALGTASSKVDTGSMFGKLAFSSARAAAADSTFDG